MMEAIAVARAALARRRSAAVAARRPLQVPAPRARRTALRVRRAGGGRVASDRRHRPSLFSTVTGAFRRRQHHARRHPPEPAPVRAEPAPQEPAPGAPRVSVRQTAGEEVGLDIPAFLRRQSS